MNGIVRTYQSGATAQTIPFLIEYFKTARVYQLILSDKSSALNEFKVYFGTFEDFNDNTSEPTNELTIQVGSDGFAIVPLHTARRIAYLTFSSTANMDVAIEMDLLEPNKGESDFMELLWINENVDMLQREVKNEW